MEYSPEEYTRFYVVQALFKLMDGYEFEKISIKDICEKAGVGRATFYRYFKKKEDVLRYYMDHNRRDFVFGQRFYPRCREDYIKLVKDIFDKFKENEEQFTLIRKARLEYIYLDYLNKNFIAMFDAEYPQMNAYVPYMYAGMLFNVSMAWLDNSCSEPSDVLAETVVSAIYQ